MKARLWVKSSLQPGTRVPGGWWWLGTESCKQGVEAEEGQGVWRHISLLVL